MTEFLIVANKDETSLFGETLNKDGLAVVPSYLMKTPSRDFSLEADRIKNEGILKIDIEVDAVDDSLINILILEGYFKSGLGKHYVTLRETAILDLTAEANGDYFLSAQVDYTEGQYTTFKFVFDLVANPLVGTKLAGITMLDGSATITSIEPAKTLYEIDASLQAIIDAIINLSSSQGSISNVTPAPILATPTILDFKIDSDSSNTSVFEFDATNELITFKLNTVYNFLSTLTIKSTTASLVNVTFNLINNADESVISTQTLPVSIGNGNMDVFPLNTLVSIGDGTNPNAPVSIRVEAVADATGIELVSFNSILSAGVSVDGYTKAQIDAMLTAGSGGGVDADLLDGSHADSTATGNTIAKRTADGDVIARLFKSNFAEVTSMASTADVCFRNSTTDDYLRFITRDGLHAYLTPAVVFEGIGTYGFFLWEGLHTGAEGTTGVAGSQLTPASTWSFDNPLNNRVTGNLSAAGTSPSGTWRCMGLTSASGASVYGISLWYRYA